MRELSIEDTSTYKEMLRMSHEDFLTILGFIERDISPYQVAGGHTVIEPKCRLTITLRFLATGETFRSLALQFRISRAAISYIHARYCKSVENPSNTISSDNKTVSGRGLKTTE